MAVRRRTAKASWAFSTAGLKVDVAMLAESWESLGNRKYISTSESTAKSPTTA